ncbi:hypothetical protein ILUMI_03588 [Ignelater luminosus]|uniref:DNA-directed RNA polymerase I subunit RPA43 n=1 Tax=Ignelater luminosus TaxID=2038154 RepID=A0A8K0GFD5_IGNLU|nr:hypothetical protein ILUMI_03588 [Ignelater luminosus]
MKRNYPAIRFEKEHLDDLVQEENSCVEIQEQNYHLALHPFHLTNINESIKDILNKGIARYDKKLGGILLGYQNIKLLSQAGTISNDSFFIHIDILASFYLFKPQVEKVLRGTVNKKSDDHVGCLAHNTFNVSLPKPEDDDDWIGLKAEIGSEILFRITFIDLDGRLPYIRAELVSIISEDDSGFSTSEENPSKPKKIVFQSDDEQQVDLNESKKKKKKDKHKKNLELEVEDEQQTKKRKRKHSAADYEEMKNTKSSKKKKLKHKENSDEILNETNIEDDEQKSKKKKKHKHKEQSHDEEIHNVSLDEENKKEKKLKKHKQDNVKYELEDTSLEYHSKKKVKEEQKDSLEELTNAVLERTLQNLSEDAKSKTKKEKKVKKYKTEVLDDDELDTTLPELNLHTLFEADDETKLIIDGNFVMADNEDKKWKKRRSSMSFANHSLDNKADLLVDSDLEKLFEDVDKSKQEKKISLKKRRRSTSSDDFETQKKKKKKIQ